MQDPKDFAPGAPGMETHRVKAVSAGLGTSFTAASKVHFSLSRGIISEISFPDAAHICAYDLEWIVTDGMEFFSEEQRHTRHEVTPLEEGIPAYRIVNSCLQGKYRITKEVVTDPLRDTVLQKTIFSPLEKGSSGEAFRLFVQMSPHIGGNSHFHNARVSQYKGIPVLVAQKGGLTMALACSHPWKASSVGFAGVSDGWMDLAAHRKLTRQFRMAESGRVSLVAEIELFPTPVPGQSARASTGQEREIVLALGFGQTEKDAASRAWASLLDGFDAARDQYMGQWRNWQRGLSPSIIAGGATMKNSIQVLRWLESKTYPGAVLSEGGVRPRDLWSVFEAYLAVGSREDALRILAYLLAAQEPGGFWPQTLHADGTPASAFIGLDQVAHVILIADACRKAYLLPPAKLQRYWPLLWKAAAYLVSSGPFAGTDRWDETQTPSVYTLAVTIAALLAAGDMADERQQPGVATYCRKTADYLEEHIDAWTYVKAGPQERSWDVKGFYAAGGEGAESRQPSPDALALVRFGLRAADDPRMLDTIKAIDACMKADTLQGPSWKRSSTDESVWPLLTAERAFYELAAGKMEMASGLQRTLEALAVHHIFPERLGADGVPRSPFPNARVHAEFIRLCCAIMDKKAPEASRFTAERYFQNQTVVPFEIWRLNAPCAYLPKGKKLRIEVPEAALIHWTDDGWHTKQHTLTRDTYLDIHVAELSPKEHASELTFTFFWLTPGRWENRNFSVSIR